VALLLREGDIGRERKAGEGGKCRGGEEGEMKVREGRKGGTGPRVYL